MKKMQKFLSSAMIMASVFGGAVSLVGPVLAQDKPADLGIGTIDGKASAIQQEVGLGGEDIRITVARIIRVAMGLLGIVAVVIMLIGGFTWMTAGGEEEKVAEAKKWIFAGIIGLAIILSAYALASFVISSLQTATTSAV